MTVRRIAQQLHRWCGLTAGLLLIVVALTGAGMVFRSQLEPLTSPQLLRVPSCAAPLPPSQLVAGARVSAAGTGALTAIRFYADPAASTRIRFDNTNWIYVDPCSGHVLGVQDAYGGPFGTLAWLHIFGYATFGVTIAGSIALAVIVLGTAGLVLWWPQRRRARRAIVSLAPAARRMKLHRTIAPWAAPVLLTLALTGIPQAFPSIATALAPPMQGRAAPPSAQEGGPSTGQVAAAQAQLNGGRSALSYRALDLAWRRATATPWMQMQWRPPRTGGEPIVVEFTSADAPHAYAAGIIHFDASTGALLQQQRYEQSAIGRKLYLWGLALHYGAVGNAAWQLILFLTALSVPVLAWTGIASWLARRRVARPQPLLTLELRRKWTVAEDICAFEFADPRGRKLPPWTAGAHVDVHVAPGVIRQYSLYGDPADRGRYLIAVHRCKPSRGGSRAMHEALRAGDRIQIGLPRNHFPLVPDAIHTVLLAGGIGITPILAMAEALAASGSSFELHYCARSRGHVAFTERLAEPRFTGRVHFHLSAEGGRADMDRLLAAARAGAQLYICGPANFTDAAVVTAAKLGWPDDAVHTERFTGAVTSQPGDRAFDLILSGSGKVIHVAPDQTALDALEAAGVDIASSCRHGICGSCATGVLEGEPDHRDQCLAPESRAANDCFTPCCSRARGERLVLDL